jgi:hypothetical protein
MRLAAHQPNYLPNLGFFYKMAQADTLVIITNVQFSKTDGWVRRHKIVQGKDDVWLSVPVLGSGQSQQIRDVKINLNTDWQRKHQMTLHLAYRATNEQSALERVLSIYDTPWNRLVDLNMAFINCLKDILDIETPLVLDEEVTGSKHELLIHLCQKYDATTYLSGMGGQIYMTEEYYKGLQDNNVTLQFVENNLTPIYPYTTLHYLFTEGLDWLKDRVQNGVVEPTLATASV